jgi:predicted Zn-dependent protease
MNRIATKLIVALLAASPFLAHAFNFNLDVDKLKGIGQKVKALKTLNEPEEIELGRDVAANIIGAAPLVNDTALQEYVNRVGKWLALHTERPGLPWRFGVLASDDVNAFATPGGIVLITRGMMLRMRDEAELAGTLAHEIVHVVEKHALKTMRKGAKWGLAADALAEYADKKGKESYGKLVTAGTEVYTRGLDKEDEFAADRMGVVIAARAGYDPFGLPSVLQTLASINPEDDAVSLMFKTHPAPSERLELLVTAMDGTMDQYAEQPRMTERFSKVMQSSVAVQGGTKAP